MSSVGPKENKGYQKPSRETSVPQKKSKERATNKLKGMAANSVSKSSKLDEGSPPPPPTRTTSKRPKRNNASVGLTPPLPPLPPKEPKAPPLPPLPPKEPKAPPLPPLPPKESKAPPLPPLPPKESKAPPLPPLSPPPVPRKKNPKFLSKTYIKQFLEDNTPPPPDYPPPSDLKESKAAQPPPPEDDELKETETSAFDSDSVNNFVNEVVENSMKKEKTNLPKGAEDLMDDILDTLFTDSSK